MNSAVTIDTQLLLSKFREAGYQTRLDPTDRAHRVYMLDGYGVLAKQILVGLVIVRLCPADLEPRVMYAEFMGRVYPMWGRDRSDTSYLQSIAALEQQIAEEAL